MPTVTERLAILVEANAGQAIAQFKTLGATTKGLSGDVGKAGGALANLGGTMGSLAGAAGPAAIVAGVGLALAKFSTQGVSAFTGLASEVQTFKRVAGGTAEDASRLVVAFKSVGIDAETAANGVFMLEKKLAAGADKLGEFGVHAVRNAKGNTDMKETLLSLGDAYKRTQDPIQRAALLTAAFGRQGTALAPLLGKTREEIASFFDAAEQHGQILSEDDLKAAREYKLSIRELGMAFKGLQVEAGKALVPLLEDIAEGITGGLELFSTIRKALHIPDESSGHSGIGGWIDSLIHGGDAAEGAKVKVGHLGEALGPINATIMGFKDAAEEAADGVKDLDKALSASASADRTLLTSRRSLTDAQDDLNKLLKEGAVDIEKVADAQRSLDEATRSVGHSQREQTKAQDEYNKALAAFNILGTDTARDKLTDAADNLADANDSLTSSQARQNEAQKELDKAKAGDPEYQTKLAKARQEVADATSNVSANVLAATRAHDAETKALKENAGQIERLLSDYDAIIKKSPEAASALAPLISALQLAQIPVAPAAPAPAAPVAPTASINSGGTSKYVTINVNSDRQIDPTHLSRTIIWELN